MNQRDADDAAHLRLTLQGTVDRFFVSEQGYFLVLGWLADEGHRTEKLSFVGSDMHLELDFGCVMRHARPDIEAVVREGAFDYGFVAFGHTPNRHDFHQPIEVRIVSDIGLFQGPANPEIVSDKRLLDTYLIVAAGAQCHAGKEATLAHFLRKGAAETGIRLFGAHVARGLSGHQVYRFHQRPVERSFVTVLFGTAEPILMQPVLFHHQGADIGEWIYVCNSPEDGEAVLRHCRLMADLYDIPITAILMTDNVGFGAANNVAVAEAAGSSIYLINPDVYPMPEHAASLNKALRRTRPGVLRGGLLFYDPGTLMHSGMFIDIDPVMRVTSINASYALDEPHGYDLLRVEHFDKSVPFRSSDWDRPKAVTAITGATMAFDRRDFEKLGGFSLGYIYGHYEDADFALRWADMIGTVEVDPDLRLIHLEGQGSRSSGPQYQAAAVINRHIFSMNHSGQTAKHGGSQSEMRLSSATTA